MNDDTSLEPYSPEFFFQLREGARQSALTIVPLILGLFQPKSVVDVGCGDGTWLSVFAGHGISDFLGIDGHYMQSTQLQIPDDKFLRHDLAQPISLGRRFDLALSLEVAEHLPAYCADQIIHTLGALSDIILFSAAIPHQGGTNHLNEQWPDYWITKFKAEQYFVLDIIRSQVWNNPSVQPWYAQNIFVFVKNSLFRKYIHLLLLCCHQYVPLPLVHPQIYLQKCLPYSNIATNTRTAISTSGSGNIVDIRFIPCSAITSGDSLGINLLIALHDHVREAFVTISISDEAGDILLDVDHHIILLKESGVKQAIVELRLSRLDLVQGKYYVNPGLFSSDWNTIHDFKWHCYVLEIQSSTSSKGLISPPVSWATSESPDSITT